MQSSHQKRIDRGLHVAIVMDGNGRWATVRGRPRREGHEATWPSESKGLASILVQREPGWVPGPLLAELHHPGAP